MDQYKIARIFYWNLTVIESFETTIFPPLILKYNRSYHIQLHDNYVLPPLKLSTFNSDM